MSRIIPACASRGPVQGPWELRFDDYRCSDRPGHAQPLPSAEQLERMGFPGAYVAVGNDLSATEIRARGIDETVVFESVLNTYGDAVARGVATEQRDLDSVSVAGGQSGYYAKTTELISGLDSFFVFAVSRWDARDSLYPWYLSGASQYIRCSTGLVVALDEGVTSTVSFAANAFAWNLIAGGWDIRIEKTCAARDGAMNHGSTSLSGGSDLETTSLQVLYSLTNRAPIETVYFVFFSGEDAERVIDSWSEFESAVYRHGQIGGIAVDCDCVTAHRSLSGEGCAYWGPDQVRIGADGLILRPARTGRLFPSIPDSGGVWTATGSAVTDYAADGLGGLRSAAALAEDGTTGNHKAHVSATVAAGNNAFGVIVEPGVRKRFRLALNLPVTGEVYADFNLSTIAVTGSSGATGTIEALGDGSFWCVIETTAAAGDAGAVDAIVYLLDASGNVSYAGDGSSGLYLYHAQAAQTTAAEIDTFIPTTTAEDSSEATNYSVDDDDLIRALHAGSLYLEAEIRVDAGYDDSADIPLFSFYESGADYVDVKLVYARSGQYNLHVGGVTGSAEYPFSTGVFYRVICRVGPDGSAWVRFVNPDTGATAIETFTGCTWPADFAPSEVRLGVLHDRTGHQPLTVKSLRSEDHA